jgi:uncharacterized protein (DUF362 family)/Pyruvate/2-oxoacid:ferredoxin oxidoreductase delta subunit
MSAPKVSLVACGSYEPALVHAKVAEALSLIGGLSSCIGKNSRVLVKPNLLMARPPESGIVTHVEVTRAVVRALKAHGCTVLVGDGPSAWGTESGNIERVYEVTQTARLCREEGVSLVTFEKHRWRGKFPLAAVLDEVDHVVTVCKLKTHGIATMTAAVKNLYGLLSSVYKAEMHKAHVRREDFAALVIEILKEARPSLAVCDAVTAMEGEGPGTSGTLRHLGLVAASSDALALDYVLAAVMGIDPMTVTTNKAAREQGMGYASLGEIELAGEPLEKAAASPAFKLPAGSSLRRNIPQPLIALARRLLTFKPVFLHRVCVRCGVCSRACPKKVITLHQGRMRIDYRGCIRCFCCQESCPHAAIRIDKSLLARVMGL